MWVLDHTELSEHTTMQARIEIELFHVTKKTDPSGRPKNTLTRGGDEKRRTYAPSTERSPRNTSFKTNHIQKRRPPNTKTHPKMLIPWSNLNPAPHSHQPLTT